MTIKERIETIMSEEIGNLDHPSFDLKYEIEAALERIAAEQKAIDIDKAHEAFVELLAVQYGEDCDESMHQYIDDALKKAMED